jgi:thymidylate kinase
MVRQEPGRWAVIDAGKKWDEVQEGLRKVIMDRLRNRKVKQE